MDAANRTVTETAPAKVNLILQVGPRRDDGLHELCSLFASIDLADALRFEVSEEGGADKVICPGVEGPNLVTAALATYRHAVRELPPLRVEVEKRIPVAAGLAGGSADAAAALRAANRIAGGRLDADGLRALGFELGADVPSQVEPGHALVEGAGERVEPVALPRMSLLLAPSTPGLATADVYAEADRIGSTRTRLDPERVRAAADASLEELASALVNHLEPAVLSLRPELEQTSRALAERGALGALISGSGPTVFGVFEHETRAHEAAAAIPNAIVAGLRAPDHRRSS